MAPPVSANASNFIAITIDTIAFEHFECPEKIDKIGLQIAMSVKKFPGGQKSVKCFGGFPPDIIQWSGIFFQDADLGADLYDRIDAIERLQIAQQPVTLTIGRFKYQVYIKNFWMPMELQWKIPYTIELVPLLDLNPATFANNATNPTASSSSSSSGSAGQSTNTGGPIPGSNATSNNSSLGPAAGNAQILNLNNSNQQLSDLLGQTAQFPTLPPATVSNLTSFQQSLTNAIQQALNNSKPVTSPTLSGSLQSAQNSLTPLISGPDPADAAFAVPANAILDNVNDALNPVPTAPKTIDVVNPNLNRIAIMEYGDPTKWEAIALANGLFTANPIGAFPKLIIPQVA